MSDKSQGVEPSNEEIVPGDPDAITEEDVETTPDELVDNPDELAAAEAAVSDPELEADPTYNEVAPGDSADAEDRDEAREEDVLDGEYVDGEYIPGEDDDEVDYVAEGEETDERIGELEGEFTEEEQAAAAAATVPAIARKTSKAPVRKKDAPTRRRSAALKEDEDPYRASNPAEFVKQSAGELRKVVWPTWPQLVTMFTAVLIFVLIIIAIVAVLDLVFGWALLQLFGS